jgi:peroxiredoxin
MKKKRLVGTVAVALACGMYFVGLRYRSGNRPAARGDVSAPDFSLPDLRGGRVKLSEYRGRVVLLDFWATWCDECRDEIPRFIEMQSKYGAQGLQIIGISMDDGPEPVREYYEWSKMNYPVAMGNAHTGELYGGVLGLPIAFVIGRDGRIYRKHVGATDFSTFENEIVNLMQK